MRHTDLALTFDDILLEPQYSDVKSRSLVDTSTALVDGIRLRVPVISANMDTVTEFEMARVMDINGAFGIIHRFMPMEDQAGEIFSFKDLGGKFIGAAIGIKDDCLERAARCIDAGVDVLCLDVAHGHTKAVGDVLDHLLAKYPDAKIIAGNVATYEGAKFLIEHGASAVKVGVGPGCHIAGTRVLMANGSYKNIEDVRIGDRVINMEGNPVSVVNSWCTGNRKVRKVRHVGFYEPTYATGDHQYFVGNLNSTSKESIASAGFAKLLTRETRTTPKLNKKQWRALEELDLDVFLAPRSLNLEVKDSLTFNLKEFAISKKAVESYDVEVAESYNLGYIFGTFLGDGTSRVLPNKSGAVHWSFGLHEVEIANKLVSAIKDVFGASLNPKISTKGTSVLQVSCYAVPLAKLFNTFGKKTQKHLPDKFLCSNPEYQQGLYDGLIDSDGHHAKDGRTTFDNTSKKLLELISVLSSNLYGSFGNFEKKCSKIGRLGYSYKMMFK